MSGSGEKGGDVVGERLATTSGRVTTSRPTSAKLENSKDTDMYGYMEPSARAAIVTGVSTRGANSTAESGHKDRRTDTGSVARTVTKRNEAFVPGYLQPVTSQKRGADSGIGRESIAPSPDSPPNDYEELPGNKYSYADPVDTTPMPPMFNKLNSCGSSSSEQLFRSTQSQYRKRENPLYDSGERGRGGEEGAVGAERGPGRCLCVAVCLLSVLAVTSLIITLCVVTGRIQVTNDDMSPKYAHLITPTNSSRLELRLEELEERYIVLQDKHEQLQGLYLDLHSNHSALKQTVLDHNNDTAKIQYQMDSLSGGVTNNTHTLTVMSSTVLQHTNQLSSLLNSVSTQHENIASNSASLSSLTSELSQAAKQNDLEAVQEELAGKATELDETARKVAQIEQKLLDYDAFQQTVETNIQDLDRRTVDINECKDRRFTSSTRSGVTFVNKNVTDLNKTSVIMSVTCAVENGKVSNFIRSPNGEVYQCKCEDIMNTSQDMTCHLFIWSCPRIPPP